jgi:hypothetical protein
MFTKEQIAEAIKDPQILVWKGAFKNTPSWEQFIWHCHDRYWNPEFEEYVPPDPKDTIVHGVNIREHFYLMMADAPVQFFPQIREVDAYLDTITPTEKFGGFTLINFVGGETPINIHSDPRHSFYWQTKGYSIWKTWKNHPGELDENGLHDSPELVVRVDEGDIIFVPHGIYHSVDTPVPRTAMSFMYELDSSITSCDCHQPEHLHNYG